MRAPIRCPLFGALVLIPALGTGCGRHLVDGLGRYDAGADAPSEMPRDAPDGPRDTTDAADRDPCIGAMVTDGGCGPTVWPNEISFTNSDKWLRDHHDQITEMRPKVLLLDFHNGTSVTQVMGVANALVDGLAQSSRFHGYSDPTAPEFMHYQIVKSVNLKDRSTGAEGASSLLPTLNGAFDPNPLFTQAFGDRYGFADPAQPTRYLTLCELFEQGKINEVWMAVGVSPPVGPLIMERKQMYDASNEPRAGMFQPCAGGAGCLPDVTCKVSVRLAHVATQRGTSCDVEIRGFPFESEGTFEALPAYATNAAAFFNSDFRKRFQVNFDSWYDLGCTDLVPSCINYPTPTAARGTDRSGAPFAISPFVQGCGSSRFPSNARTVNDFDSTVQVQTRCEHFGLKDGSNGQDSTNLYDPAKAAALTAGWTTPNDCGGGWHVYLRQNMPGYGNKAKGDDGQPMRNWWPYLFY